MYELPFTKLTIWQKAHELTIEIYKTTSHFPKDELFGLTSQIRRASISVVLCIVEGTGRYYHKEVIRFLLEARASLREVQAGLFLAKDLQYVEELKVSELIKKYSALEKQINSLINYRKRISIK